ncbi:MAG: porin [Rhodospirillaceae bacterium]|nr:porin [Rhodospirillaceae bacterium]
MKKLLLASTALLAGSAFAAQAAEPVKLSVGGFLQGQVIIMDQDKVKSAANGAVTEAANVDTMSFGQINFKGSTKLDNGIGVDVAVETLATQWADSRNANGANGNRGNGNNGNVRRAYLTLTSSFGQIILGQREDYGFITANSAPDVGWGVQDGDWGNVFNTPAGYYANWTTNNSRYNARTEKITLITPTFAGFSAGFTYTPDINQSNTGNLVIASDSDTVAGTAVGGSLINRSAFAGDQYQVGATYTNKFGDVGVKANVAVSQFDIANMTTYQGGLQVTYAGFAVGGSIFNRDVGKSERVFANNATNTNLAVYNAKGLMRAGTNFDVGASYTTGPYAVSLGYFQDKSKGLAGDAANLGNSLGLGAAGKTQVYSLAGKYAMGPGVDFRTSFYYADLDSNRTAQYSENKGFAVISGVRVTF